MIKVLVVVKKIPSTFLNYWFNFSVHFNKEQLAALLPIQEGGNEYSAKLAEFSTRKHMSSVLRQILQDKCPPLEFKSLALPKTSPETSPNQVLNFGGLVIPPYTKQVSEVS